MRYGFFCFFFFCEVEGGGTTELSFLHLEYEKMILKSFSYLPVGYIYFLFVVSFSHRNFLVIQLQSC